MHNCRYTLLYLFVMRFTDTANPTWGVIFESSKLKARTSLLPRFSEKRRSSFELWALNQQSKMSPQVGLAVHTQTRVLCLYQRWLWLVGSLKLSVSFREYRLFYRDLLQKRPTIFRSSLIVASPYSRSSTAC